LPLTQIKALFDFGRKLKDYLAAGPQPHMIVMNGDSSLSAALEQCLTASHTIPSDTASKSAGSRRAAAQTLAASAAAAEQERASLSATQEPQETLLRLLTSKNYLTMLSAPSKACVVPSDLPLPLKPLSVFWDLHPQQAAQPGHSHSLPRSSKAKQRSDGGSGARQGHSTSRPHSQRASRPGSSRQSTQSGSARSVVWTKPWSSLEMSQCPERPSSFWGDLQGALNFRRFLLNPELTYFGAARCQDVCIFWASDCSAVQFDMVELQASEEVASECSDGGPLETTMTVPVVPTPTAQERASSSNSTARASPALSVALPDKLETKSFGRSTPWSVQHAKILQRAMVNSMRPSVDAVCFPPAGIVPLQMLRFANMPWTIMPDSAYYQPTQHTCVQVWRVRIDRNTGGNWTAERLDSVRVGKHLVDCSCAGNAFCVIFFPEVAGFNAGDQFEVVLQGLRGKATQLTHFHEVQALQQTAMDTCLCQEAERMRNLLGNPNLWGEGAEAPPHALRALSMRSEASRPSSADSSSATAKSEIIPVSHTSLSFATDTADVTIVVRSDHAAWLRGTLALVRRSGDELIGRSTQVLKLGSHFVVKAKLPMAGQKYRLYLAVATLDVPDTLCAPSLSYLISTTDLCPSILLENDAIMFRQYGYAELQCISQLCGLSLIAPAAHALHPGFCYFLLHVDAFAPGGGGMSSLTHGKLEKQVDDIGHPSKLECKPSVLFNRRLVPRGGFRLRAGADTVEVTPSTSCYHMQAALREVLEHYVQDTGGFVHFDVSIADGRQLVRLMQRVDFPELFEAYVWLTEDDIDTKVRLFMRRPKVHVVDYASEKICEWSVVEEDPCGL